MRQLRLTILASAVAGTLFLADAPSALAQGAGRGTPASILVGSPEWAPSGRQPYPQPYQSVLELSLSDGHLAAEGTFEAVPAGKQLVIEALYATVGATVGYTVIIQIIQNAVRIPVPLTLAGASIEGDISVAAQATRLYVSAGPPLQGRIAALQPNLAASAFVTITAVGYLVNLP